MKTSIRLAILAGAMAGICSANLSPVLTLLPSGGAVSGTPGSTVGWGYSIFNPTANYLLTYGLSSGAFPAGAGTAIIPNAIFDFPIVGPGQTITEQYSTSTLSGPCPGTPCGLLQAIIPSSTLPEVVTGIFTINGEYFADAALNTDLGPSPDLTASYSVSVVTAASPEPGLYGLVALGLVGLRAASVRRRRSDGRQ
jgi:hypothetical protein